MSLTLKQFTPLLAALFGMGIMAETGQAQSITSAADGTKTIVTPDGNRFDIHGGSLSGDGTNLFHSFEKFGLSQEQIANFLSNPQIQNILGRVVGGNASFIDGLIQVTGGNSNLFLMNPSGLIFGNNAQLSVPASFTATTANGIQFGDRWFNASGMNDHAALVGNPSGFAFTMAEPGAIINTGDLAVGSKQSLSLLGGTVASTGQLSAPGGEIIVTAVPGESLVRLNMPGNVLGIEIESTALGGSQPSDWNLPITALPDLLTVGAIEQDTGLAVNPEGQVILAESDIPVASGDVTVQELSAQSAVLSANQNLTLVESQLSTTGNLQLLAKDTVRIRDSATKPFLAQAEGDLYIQGNQNIDILALNHPETPFQSGGDLTLVSDGDISGDAHFASGGNFSLLNLKGEPGNFVSYYDPIITAVGDVEFGNYTGVALKVEATGSIEGGDIRITGPDTNLSGSDPDIPTLTSSPALILRAGVSLFDLENRPNDPQSAGGTRFTASREFSSSGAINVGSIDTSSMTGNGGPVILDAVGDVGSITVNGDINTSSTAGDGGEVNLSAFGGEGNITIDGGINTSSEAGQGGSVMFNSEGDFGNIQVESNIDTSSSGGEAGTVNLRVLSNNGRLVVNGNIDASSTGGNGGNIDLQALGSENVDGSIQVEGKMDASSRGTNGGDGGDINLSALGAVGTITVRGDIDTSSTSENTDRTGNGGSVNLEALGDIEVLPLGDTEGGTINTQGSEPLRAELEDIGQDIETEGIADGGDITINTQGTFRLGSRDGENIKTNIDNLDPVSITAQGANDPDARGGKIDIRIGSNFDGESVAFGSGFITNSPVDNTNLAGDIPSNTTEEQGFQNIDETGGGFPTPRTQVGPATGGGTGTGGGVTNNVAPATPIANDNAQDAISRQSATITPGITVVDNVLIQIADATPLEKEIDALKNQCEDEERWNEFIVEIQDENLRKQLEEERAAICETQDSSQTDDSRDSQTAPEAQEEDTNVLETS